MAKTKTAPEISPEKDTTPDNNTHDESLLTNLILPILKEKLPGITGKWKVIIILTIVIVPFVVKAFKNTVTEESMFIRVKLVGKGSQGDIVKIDPPALTGFLDVSNEVVYPEVRISSIENKRLEVRLVKGSKEEVITSTHVSSPHSINIQVEYRPSQENENAPK